MKLVVREPETDALVLHLAGRDVVTSELALAEVPRALRRVASGRTKAEHEGLLHGIDTVLNGVALVPVNREILVAAGRFREAFLRTLDAIHLASALVAFDDLESFVTYDEDQAGAARHAGFDVAAPS